MDESLKIMQQTQRDISVLAGRIDKIENIQRQIIAGLNETLPQHKRCIANLDNVLMQLTHAMGMELNKETLKLYTSVDLNDKCDETDPLFN